MKYQPPYGSTDPNASYIDGNPALGIEGSPVPKEAIEYPMREIINVITAAGITPNDASLAQLLLAIQTIIGKAISELPSNDRYDIGEFYYFRHPVLKPGFQPMYGGLLTGAADNYPEIWQYLQTTDGQRLCVTEAEWQAMTQAIWATLADGTQIGWNGIGGAPCLAMHMDTGALRLPDVRGMFIEAAGFDSLGVGEVDGDRGRNFEGVIGGVFRSENSGTRTSGIVTYGSTELSNRSPNPSGGSTWGDYNIVASRVVPTGPAFAPRRWGALACVYLGRPK